MQITGPLRIGNRNNDVRTVQEALNAAGRKPPLGADGKFGRLTHKAVVAFQDKKGLKCDGVVGPKTATALGLGYTASAALLYPGRRRRPPPAPGDIPAAPLPALGPAPSALEIVANGLIAEFDDYFLVITWEIRKAGGTPEKVSNAVGGLGLIRASLFERLRWWGTGELGERTTVALGTTILEATNSILGEVGPYLKRHGSNTRGLAERLDRLDTRAIEAAVQKVIDGNATAEDALAEIRTIMDKMVSIGP
jgi:peptidoglycan hydrolase-like protein with peptidoglycan-binding domain